MRQGLKNRIKFDPNNPTRMSMIKTDYLQRNSFNSRIPNGNCAPTSGCSNVQDASGFWIGTNQTNLETQRKYYAPFRQPVKGYRKTLYGWNNGLPFQATNRGCLTTTEIYKDVYADCSGNECMNNGSISNSKIPLTGTSAASRSSTGNATRTQMPLIRSGMQPNIAGKQNSGLSNTLTATRYSYSYRELINNRKKVAYEKQLPTKLSNADLDWSTSAYGGVCNPLGGGSLVTGCGSIKTIYKPNNEGFDVQGAVDSSDRITKLKLNTIKAGKRCGPEICKGIYRTGNAQTAVDTVMWPKPTNDYDKVKYKSKFNSNHFEVNYPQVSALARVRGESRQRKLKSNTYIVDNNTVCCSDPDKANNGY